MYTNILSGDPRLQEFKKGEFKTISKENKKSALNTGRYLWKDRFNMKTFGKISRNRLDDEYEGIKN